MSFAKHLLAAAVATAFTAPAMAQNMEFLGYANGSETVSYKLDYADNSLDRSGAANAGGFLSRYNGGPTFVSYCIDLYQFISLPASYGDYSQVSSNAYAGFTFNTNAAGLLAGFLLENNPVGNSVQSAAFQVAVWELMYENTGVYNVGSGSASFTSDTGLVLSTAQGWLDVLAASSTPFAVYQSPAYQDVITAPVPEPETYALMAAGLGALGFIGRRRKARATA